MALIKGYLTIPRSPVKRQARLLRQIPAPVAFLGGAGQLSAGSTAYVTVALEPGRDAWISEEYGNRGVVREFMVE